MLSSFVRLSLGLAFIPGPCPALPLLTPQSLGSPRIAPVSVPTKTLSPVRLPVVLPTDSGVNRAWSVGGRTQRNQVQVLYSRSVS